MNYRNLNYEDPNDIKKAILNLSCCTSSGSGLELGGELIGGDPNAVLHLDGSSQLATSTNFTYNPSAVSGAATLDVKTVDGKRIAQFQNSNSTANPVGTLFVSYLGGANGFSLAAVANNTAKFTNGILGVNITPSSQQFAVQTSSVNNVGIYVNGITGQTAKLQEWNVNGVLKASIDPNGTIRTLGSNNEIRSLRTNGAGLSIYQPMNISSGGYMIYAFQADMIGSSAADIPSGIRLQYGVSQSGSAGYRSIYHQITETSVGSGMNRFIDFEINGTSKYRVDKSSLGVVQTVGDSSSGLNAYTQYRDATAGFRVGWNDFASAAIQAGASKSIYMFVNSSTNWESLSQVDADFTFDSTGLGVGVGISTAAKLHVLGSDVSTIGAIVDTPTGQTANLQEWQVNGSTGAYIDSNYQFYTTEGVRIQNNGSGGSIYLGCGYGGGKNIGLSRGARLGWSQFGDNSQSSITYIEANDSTGVMDFGASGGFRFNNYIQTSGYIFNGTLLINTNRIYNSSTTNGTLQFGSNTIDVVDATLSVTNDDVADITMIVDAITGTTANLQEWQVNGTTVASVTSFGKGNFDRIACSAVQSEYINTQSNSNTVIKLTNGSSDALFYGGIKPATLTDASAPNNSIYYSSTAGKLVYKDSGGTVNNLY